MRQGGLKLLTDKLFLLGLFCLLINDFVLKYQVGGFVTGKLSDIAGLFIFPFFWSAIFLRHKLKIYLLTILLFGVWKTALSTGLINWTNHILGTEFGRVIDYTDLFALFIIPISYRHFKRKAETTAPNESSPRIVPIIVMSVSIFSFVATSLPRAKVKSDLEVRETYIIDLDKKEIFLNRIEPARGLSDSLTANLVDSLFYIDFDVDGHDLLAKVKILKIDEGKTSIEFVSLSSYVVTGGLFSGIDEDELERMKKLKKEDYKKLFETGVIEAIKTKSKFESNIFYWNPKLDPIILE